MEVDRRLLTLVLTGGQSKRSTIVVDLFLNKEGDPIDSSSEGTSSWHSRARCSSSSGCLSDSHTRNDSGCARDSCARNHSWDGDELSDSVSHGGAGNSDSGSLSARALRDDGRSRNDRDGTADCQCLATIANKGAWVDNISVDDGGSNISSSSTSISAGVSTGVSTSSSASIARSCTRSECSGESDHWTRCNHSGASGARTVREDCGTCDHGWSSTDSDSLAAIASQRRRVHQLSDSSDSRKGGHIACRVGRGRRWYGVARCVKVDSLGSWTSRSDELSDGSGRTGVAGLGTRSCCNHSTQAEEAREMDPRVHDTDRRTKVQSSEGSQTMELEAVMK